MHLWQLKETDVSDYFAPLEDYFPCCPICDNEIGDWDNPTIIKRANGLALAHESCVDDIDSFMEKHG